MLLTIAAILLIAIGLAHSVLGERYILVRLFRREVPKLFGSETYTQRTLRFAWHITTVAWWGFAALLLALLEESSRAVYLNIIAFTFLVSDVLALVGSRGGTIHGRYFSRWQCWRGGPREHRAVLSMKKRYRCLKRNERK